MEMEIEKEMKKVQKKIFRFKVGACIDAIGYICAGVGLYMGLDKLINTICPENMKYLAKLGNVVMCSSIIAWYLYRLYHRVIDVLDIYQKEYQRLYQKYQKLKKY